MEVLTCFAVSEAELGVTEIAQMLKMNKSTVFNTLLTLAQCGILVKNPISNKYYPSLFMLRLSHNAVVRSGVRNIFGSYLNTLMQRTRKVCSYVILDRSQVLCVLSTSPEGYPQEESFPGQSTPLYCSSAGKIFLAYMSDDALDAALSMPMTGYTSLTISDPGILRQMLPDIREQGYAIDNMEHTYGMRSVAIPLFDTAHEVHAAICVSSPTTHFSLETIAETARIAEETFRPLQGRL
jgi:DNA-binding IclR family transcriptional regulator